MIRPFATGAITAACATACALWSCDAAAQNPSESFRPSASVHSHITTESSEVLPKWTPTAAVVTSYGRTVSNRGPSDLSIDARTTSHVLLGFGIAGWTELSIDVPLVVHQRGVGIEDGQLATLPGGAVGDLRLGLKGTILHTPRRGFGLGLSFDVTAPTGDPTAMTGYGEPTYAPQLLLEQRLVRGITAGVNVGYIARPEVNAGGVVFGDAVTYRAGLRIPLSEQYRIDALAEMDGAFGIVRGSTHPLAMRGGFRWQLRSGMLLGIYGGGAPVAALGLPDVEVMFGIGYAPVGRTRTERAFERDSPSVASYASRYDRRTHPPQKAAARPTDPADPDGDGLVAQQDRCPTVAEDVDDFEDDDGCPELDNDRDGVRDPLDLCTTEPEIINGYQDEDGCPDRRLADGGGETLRRFDPATLLPRVAFTPDSAEPTQESIAALESLAELVRLNPWIAQLRMRVYVRGTDDPRRDHELAQRRAVSIRQFLLARGVQGWRVAVDEPRAVPEDTEPRLTFALTHRSEGLAPLAPSETAMHNALAREDELAPTGAEPAPPSEPSPGPVVEAQGPGESGPAQPEQPKLQKPTLQKPKLTSSPDPLKPTSSPAPLKPQRSR